MSRTRTLLSALRRSAWTRPLLLRPRISDGMRLGEVVRWIHLFLIVLRRKPFRPQNTMQVSFSSPMAEAAVKRHLESATYTSTVII